jgi:hypothetical protein
MARIVITGGPPHKPVTDELAGTIVDRVETAVAGESA